MLLTDIPSSRYSPLVGVSRHPNVFNKVDLPEPDVPMMVTNSPSLMVKETPRKACTISSPTKKSRLMLCSSITFLLILLRTLIYFFLFPPGLPGMKGLFSVFPPVPISAILLVGVPRLASLITWVPSLIPPVISVLFHY